MLDKSNAQLQVLSSPCGFLNGEPLYSITLSNADITIEITNLGATITAIFTGDKNGDYHNIVAGYPTVSDYQNNPHYFGCILGRYAGRIADSKFKLDDEVIFLSRNDGMHHLHGGVDGFSKKVWKVKSFINEETETGVIMEYFSPDGEEGYPGNLWVTVKYILGVDNKLILIYNAVTDKSTPVNLSNHSYFNLNGFKTDVLDHQLWLNADSYLESDKSNLPTGKILPVFNGAMDFSIASPIGSRIADTGDSNGYNHNFICNNHIHGNPQIAATLADPQSGRQLKIYTDCPGMQLYTANDWQGTIIGPQGFAYGKHSAVALETQAYPDSPNHTEFPNTILHPGLNFKSVTAYEFSIIDQN